MNENGPDRRFELAAKILSGNATKKDAREMDALDNHERSQLIKVWELTKRLDATPERLAKWQDSAQALKVQVASQRIASGRLQTKSSRNFVRYTLKIAATLVITIVSLFAIFRNWQSEREFVTQNGEQITVPLPDSTEVELNASSRLTYDMNSWPDFRGVTLQGEAFFRVQTGMAAFTVTTENARAEVLGTAFNVNSRHGKTALTVERGRVAFESLITSDRVVLQQFETSIIADGKPSHPRAVDLKKILAWRKGELVFERTPISEVFEELERQFDKKIQIPPDVYKDLTYTASFDSRQSAENVLEKICVAFGWKLSATNGVFVIEETSRNP
ncbi:FecR domain-containing protein [bacterium]|nr:FecR domain-containing protein [bacterium]